MRFDNDTPTAAPTQTRMIAHYWCDERQTTRRYPLRAGSVPVKEFTTPTNAVYRLVSVHHVTELDAATVAAVPNRTPYLCTACSRPDCVCDWYEETEAERVARLRGLDAIAARVRVWNAKRAGTLA